MVGTDKSLRIVGYRLEFIAVLSKHADVVSIECKSWSKVFRARWPQLGWLQLAGPSSAGALPRHTF
jgi:hypothetical protein